MSSLNANGQNQRTGAALYYWAAFRSHQPEWSVTAEVAGTFCVAGDSQTRSDGG